MADLDLGFSPPSSGGQQGPADLDLGFSRPAGEAMTPAAAPVSTTADVAKSAGSGLRSGVEGLIGVGGDIRHAVDYGMLWAEAKTAEKMGLLPQGQTADDVIKQYRGSAGRAFLSSLGVSDKAIDIAGSGAPTTSDVHSAVTAAGVPDYQPQTTAGKYAQTVGSFVPGALALPAEGPLGVAANVGKYAAIPGVASEAAGQAAQVNAPGLEPYARIGAGLAAGSLPALAETGTRAAARGIGDFVEPLTQIGQQALATRKLQNAFTNPQVASKELEAASALQVPGAAMGEIVPGSKPTTGQLTGDLGALSLERELATRQPDQFKSNQFGTGAEQQNAARTNALQSIQPNGSPSDVGHFVRNRLSDIEGQHDAAVNQALSDAQNQAAQVGTGATPEALGADLRGRLQAARDAAKVNERQLWSAVDPDGTLSLPASPVSGAAKAISASIPQTARPMSGEEAAIFSTASGLPNIASFNDITALRSRISTAMREELRSAGQSPTYGRLSQLRSSVEGAIEDAASHKSAADDAAVSAGSLNDDQSVRSRISRSFGQGSSQSAGQDIGRGIAQTGTASPPNAPSPIGTGSQGVGGLRYNAGNQGISGQGAGTTAGSQVGKVYYPSGSLDVNYEVANLPDLITSHDTNFNVNKAYPAELQPRARETAPARDQVNTMAARLQPERLGPSPEANSGAPIVGPDNVVESGNGRTLALAKAYQSGRAGDYQAWLRSQGVDTSGVPYPVLIGRRTTPLSSGERVAFAHSANTASGLKMNAAEQARADARLLTPGSIEDGAALNSEANRPFVRSFLSQLPPSERGGMLDATGNLSQGGIRRLEGALSARAYGDPEYTARAFDAADPNIRGIAGALTDAAPAWMKMREAAREGAIDPAHDVTPDLMNAVRSAMRARDAGRPISEVLNQSDMFGGEASQLAKNFILNDRGGVASREQIAGRLNRYATEAQKNLAGPSLFGDTVSPSDVLKTTLRNEGFETPTMESAAMQGAPQSNFDVSAAARLRAASQATKQRAQTFDQGPVGNALRTTGNAGDYRMPNSAVPGNMFAPGPRGAQIAQSYQRAAGTMEPLTDAAAESLRREAMTPEGIIDPAKFARWQAKYQDALRTLPNGGQFSNAASASRAYGDAVSARKDALDSFQKSVAGRFAGLNNPQDITKTVGSIFGSKDSVRQMQSLAQTVSASPEATEGLRKAVADHIMGLATGTTESGASGVNNLNPARLSRFLTSNGEAIKAAGFSDPELASMRAVSDDLQRSQRTLQATRLPGQSNTAQDIIRSLDEANKVQPMSLMSKLFFSGEVGGPGAMAAVVGHHVAAYLRGAGLAKANALVRDAMLNPELARELLKAPTQAARPSILKILGRQMMFNAASNAAGAHAQPYARGGSVKPKMTREQLLARLFGMVEKAQKAEKKRTKPILKIPDEAVAHALRKADAAI